MDTPSTDTVQSDQTAPPRNIILRHPWGFATLALILLFPSMRPCTRFEPRPPAVVSTVQPFELVDHEGRVFNRETMSGRLWLVGFFFSRHPVRVETLFDAFHTLRERFRRDALEVAMVAITVDPEDSLDVLKDLAQSHSLTRNDTFLLTGTEARLRHTVIECFDTTMGKPVPYPEDRGLGPHAIAHEQKLLLVDSKGQLRGRYGTHGAGLDEIYHRTMTLARHRGSAP